MSPDLRHATVFVKPLLGADEEEVLKALAQARPLPARRGVEAGEHQICRQPQIPRRRELRRRQPYRFPLALAHCRARSGSGMKFGFALIAAVLGAAPLQAQVTPSADDARAAIAAVLAHQVSMRGPTGAGDICVAGALTGLPPAPDAEDPVGPERAVHIRFQWHVPESAMPVRPPRVEPEPGERRERRERRRLLPERQLPAPLAPELASELDALRAEASRSTSTPVLTAIDAGSIPAPLRLLQQDMSCWRTSSVRPRVRRGRCVRLRRLSLRHVLRRRQPLCAAPARDAMGGGRRRRYLDQLGRLSLAPISP